MYKFKSDFLRFIYDRGYIYQISDEEALDEVFFKGKVTAYIGFDCTAPNLHIGSLMQIMLLKHLQDFGHKPIALIGGATSKVGDPSLKDKSRKILSKEEVDRNIKGIKKIFDKFLNTKKGKIKILNNDDWLGSLNYIDFLRKVGSNFSVNKMLSFDSVKLRLEREQPLSFLEFNYMVMQGYDFFELNKKHNCTLQMGGSDQWGNIVCGIDLARRLSGTNLYGLTTPLLTTSSGEKMGKTEKGAVWLSYDEDNSDFSTHPRDFWNYWRDKTENESVGKLMRLFTNLPLKEIEEYEKLQNEEIEISKEVLATNITEMVHGKDSEWDSVAEFILKKNELDKGIGLLALLSNNYTELTSSNSESRRFVKSNAVKINDKLISDEKYVVTLKDFESQNVIKISLGKKKHILVKLT
jgi:tyrosyl-tRNA synthetase|tara:strand:- start:4843 stop:6069 length:1227 start_codon:yes stop_codon:yes gene_type:complete